MRRAQRAHVRTWDPRTMVDLPGLWPVRRHLRRSSTNLGPGRGPSAITMGGRWSGSRHPGAFGPPNTSVEPGASVRGVEDTAAMSNGG